MGFAGFAVLQLGGFGALNAGLLKLAADPAAAGKFIVSGVVQFTAGGGRQAAAAHEGTALASLAMVFALMGLQSSPMAIKVVLSTNSPRAIAAGQTWVMAGAFGAMIALCVACFGAASLIDPSKDLSGLLTSISPWFAAWLFIGLLAGVQLMAGLALLTAGESLIRNVYKPWFHSSLSRRDTVTITRVAIGLLVLASGLMQMFTPVTLSMLASLALPLAFQLWTPLVGMTWLRWFTRPGVVTGVGFGIAGVLLTEPFGIAVLSALGLELPWAAPLGPCLPPLGEWSPTCWSQCWCRRSPSDGRSGTRRKRRAAFSTAFSGLHRGSEHYAPRLGPFRLPGSSSPWAQA